MSELFEGAQDAEEMDLILAVAAHQETMAETLLWLGKVLPASRERRDAFMFSSSLGHIEASALRERAADYEARALKTLGGKAIDQ